MRWHVQTFDVQNVVEFNDLNSKIAKTNGAMKEYLESLKKVFKFIIK